MKKDIVYAVFWIKIKNVGVEMLSKNIIFCVLYFSIFCINFQMHSWTNLFDHSTTQLGQKSEHYDKVMQREKPSFLRQGEYKDGKYLQFTVDKSAFFWGCLAGVSMRSLVSLAQCGTKIESFKSSVLRPGIVKSMLFWIPMTIGYRYALAVKNNQKLQERLATYGENMARQFSLDGQKPGQEE